jgi:hypothetical protein
MCCVVRFVARRLILNSSLLKVLCRPLRHVTIYFKFIFIKVLYRALRRAMIRFKCSSVDISRRAFHRVTLNVYL